MTPVRSLDLRQFAKGIYTINDLEIGMVLPGIVTNITAFGAFVDIGIKQNGLIHKSNMADKYVSDPSEYVKLNQKVKVKIVEVDKIRGQIQLSMKEMEQK